MAPESLLPKPPCLVESNEVSSMEGIICILEWNVFLRVHDLSIGASAIRKAIPVVAVSETTEKL